MSPPFRLPSKFVSNQRCGMASHLTRQVYYILCSNWPKPTREGIMSIAGTAVALSFFALTTWPFEVLGPRSDPGPPTVRSDQQSSPSNGPASETASFDQVVKTMVERERLFVAQMRHFHPLIETYIQN